MDMILGAFLAPDILPFAIVGAVVAILALGFNGAPLWLWSLFLVGVAAGFGAPVIAVGLLVVILAVFNIPPIRKAVVSSGVMATMKALKLIPKISETERTALEAGVVWMEAELFSGRPDFKKMMDQPFGKLSAEEKDFIENDLEELCALIDDWKFWKTREMQEEVFEFIKRKKLLGMIIPKEYGGLGFSHTAHSMILQKISSRSIPASITIMVPNSLGPAELLNHYGTQEQKDKYLSRLADGSEIPCFGLTEPMAGSDAGSLTSTGVLFKGEDGRLKMRLNWRKRWITLASISTIIGLAFRLKDPEGLLGREEDLGITCALIPSNTPGVQIGERHDPLGVPFHNCPMEGHDVVVDAEECIIGGTAKAGEGWQMLMESLGAGRGISLPAQSAGGNKMISRVVSNHATIRKQFGMSIGKFEGVEEPMARIAANTYMTESMSQYVLSALDQGIAPPVVTAMAKYYCTEMARETIKDGMDVLGGAGISMGPRNLIATGWISIPISVTVEGANILTRTLMIFGQGALRAHPYAFKEVDAIENNDLAGFDKAFWGHIGHIVRNMFRSIVLSWSRGFFGSSPVSGPAKGYFRKLAWTSASFAIMADLAMGLLGGQLKAKQKLTGRLADIMGYMFIATSVLKKFEADGSKKEHEAVFHLTMQTIFHRIQEAFDGIFANMDVPVIGLFFKGPVLWWSKINAMASAPKDSVGHAAVKSLLEDASVREVLSRGIYIPKDPTEALGRLEQAYDKIIEAKPIEKKVKKAIRASTLPKKPVYALLDEAVKAGVITEEEKTVIADAEKLRYDAIQVDSFTQEEYLPGGLPKEEEKLVTPQPHEVA
jgi:acyl-CoA dehydrogenase